MILVPVKNLSLAKLRLSSILDQPARTQLAQAMLHDVLEAVASWENRPEVAIVTCDSFALGLAAKFGFEVIADPVNASETDAIAVATHVCETRGLDFTLVIPADIPLIQGWELQRIMDAAPTEGCVLVPAVDGRGTNAIFRRPVGLIPLQFGNDSFKPHLAAAKATGKSSIVLSLPGIAVDVDNPADLRQLVDMQGETRAQHLARQWELRDLPLAANE
jgi:2-phospho-L-lactate/phosphoenolpyruvate guanylyltransferase